MGFRVIKTAIAALLAILIADAFAIKGALSAGLLAILGVEVTRKRSLQTISARFFASLLGLFFACVLFAVLGFHYWVLALYILIAFPAISKANFKEGIVTSSVIVFRVFDGQDLSADTLISQTLLLIIGLGSAMLVNMIYMPAGYEKMTEIRRKLDGLFANIFIHYARTLRDPSYIWDGAEIIEAGEAIKNGTTAAKRAMENQMLSPDEAWHLYFVMRRQQLETIQNMMQLIACVYQKLPHGEYVAELFEQLSQDVQEHKYTGRTEKMLRELEQNFKLMELPASREEFEIRSAILQLCRELSSYLKTGRENKAPTPGGVRAAG